MTSSTITLNGMNRTVYLTEGVTLANGTKIAGVFLTEEAARMGDGHEEAILNWNQLSDEQQEVARANSEWLSD